jgi:hypothetical protein
MNYWTPLQILRQTAGELGLTQPSTVVGLSDVQSLQLMSMLQSAGNELLLYYPWEQFAKTFTISLVAAQEGYALPTDYSYFRDQTQWDANNHWPLLGPKSAQEWAWLKNSFVASLPRLRYRIQQNLFKVYPTPQSSVANALNMEYVSRYWVALDGAPTVGAKDLVSLDNDICMYDPWMLIKYIKLKFYDLKGFDTRAVQSDFLRIFDSLTGKDTGAEKLNLAPAYQTPYVGPWSIPDGSWNV